MKAITLRNLPPELAKTIRQKAEEQGTSINKAVINLLEEGTGIRGKRNGKKSLHHDLDSLAGSWTRDEAEEFDFVIPPSRPRLPPSESPDAIIERPGHPSMTGLHSECATFLIASRNIFKTASGVPLRTNNPRQKIKSTSTPILTIIY